MFPNPPDETALCKPQALSTQSHRPTRLLDAIQSRSGLPRAARRLRRGVRRDRRTRDAAQVAAPPSRMATRLSSVRRTSSGA